MLVFLAAGFFAYQSAAYAELAAISASELSLIFAKRRIVQAYAQNTPMCPDPVLLYGVHGADDKIS